MFSSGGTNSLGGWGPLLQALLDAKGRAAANAMAARGGGMPSAMATVEPPLDPYMDALPAQGIGLGPAMVPMPKRKPKR